MRVCRCWRLSRGYVAMVTDATEYHRDRGQRYVVQYRLKLPEWQIASYTDSAALSDYGAWLLLQFTAYCEETRVIDRQPERQE
jgi:hypothetical protein